MAFEDKTTDELLEEYNRLEAEYLPQLHALGAEIGKRNGEASLIRRLEGAGIDATPAMVELVTVQMAAQAEGTEPA